MLTRALGVGAVVAAGLVPSCQPSCEPPAPPSRDVDEVVALVVDGLDTAWTRVIDADLVETRYGLGSLVEVSGDGGQVHLVGTVTERTVSAAELDAAYALPSSQFAIAGVTRDLASDVGFTFIGDSLGVSITTGTNDELPALLDGVFVAPRYDSVGGRCTADPGCASTGLDAAENVPGGAGVVVMELGHQRRARIVRHEDRPGDGRAGRQGRRSGGVADQLDAQHRTPTGPTRTTPVSWPPPRVAGTACCRSPTGTPTAPGRAMTTGSSRPHPPRPRPGRPSWRCSSATPSSPSSPPPLTRSARRATPQSGRARSQAPIWARWFAVSRTCAPRSGDQRAMTAAMRRACLAGWRTIWW